jgi:hypothetical protein
LRAWSRRVVSGLAEPAAKCRESRSDGDDRGRRDYPGERCWPCSLHGPPAILSRLTFSAAFV